MHMHAMNRNEKVSKIRTICVYCGSSPGTDPAFVEAARVFGTILANNGIRLVFGGGAVGIMGAIAKSVVDHGGKITGIIPEFLVAREHAMRGADSLIITRDMHERKRKMFEMADAFVALPGGIGTLEEVVEQITWVQLGRHRKPILLANIDGLPIDRLGILGSAGSLEIAAIPVELEGIRLILRGKGDCGHDRE